jgi:hypothetical protein
MHLLIRLSWESRSAGSFLANVWDYQVAIHSIGMKFGNLIAVSITIPEVICPAIPDIKSDGGLNGRNSFSYQEAHSDNTVLHMKRAFSHRETDGRLAVYTVSGSRRTRTPRKERTDGDNPFNS